MKNNRERGKIMDKFQGWLGYALERAIKTFAQTFLAVVGGGQLVGIADVDWLGAASIAAVAAVLSLLTSVIAWGTPIQDATTLRNATARPAASKPVAAKKAPAKKAPAKKAPAKKTATKK
jgi:hypothetical protein